MNQNKKDSLKIAILGFGSIAKRHLKNIKTVLDNKQTAYSIDLIRQNKNKEVDGQYLKIINKIYSEQENIDEDYDIIFITNPTEAHYKSIKKYVKNTKHMFIEKPVFSDSNTNLHELSLKENGIYYVACPLRYTKVIQFVRENVDLNDIYSVRAISSSYLPDWRPGVDYRKVYSSSVEMGGGVSIDLIHEWDYLVYLFGLPLTVNNFKGTFSNLEIDSDDLSIYIAKYKDFLVELHLDYFGRSPIREIQLFTKDDTIIADIANSMVTFKKNGEVLKFNENRNSYQLKEMENFFDIISGEAVNENNVELALQVLNITKEAKLI